MEDNRATRSTPQRTAASISASRITANSFIVLPSSLCCRPWREGSFRYGDSVALSGSERLAGCIKLLVEDDSFSSALLQAEAPPARAATRNSPALTPSILSDRECVSKCGNVV